MIVTAIVTPEGRTLVLGLSQDGLDRLDRGEAIKFYLRDFGVEGPLGDKIWAVLREGPELEQWRRSRMAPREYGRVDCLAPHSLRLLAAGGHVLLPRGRHGLETLLVGRDGLDAVKRALAACGRPWGVLGGSVGQTVDRTAGDPGVSGAAATGA